MILISNLKNFFKKCKFVVVKKKIDLMKGSAGGSRIFSAFVTAALCISGCAKISSPAGGPRDREPPVILRSIPEQGTRNFSGNAIMVTFNEYVVLDKINEKFMVSPPLSRKPRIYIRGKNMHVQFEEKLRDSSTYTLYFQDAIRDLNEGNPIDNYQFVFSTGPVIDSLSVTGNVFNAFNLEVPENTLVLLYSQMADTAVVKQLPDYITRVRKNSEFRIDNIKPGRYRIYALKDADNSKNYNLRDEEFAFLADTVIIDPVKNYLPADPDTVVSVTRESRTQVVPPVEGEYRLILFQAEKKNHYLTSASRRLPYQMIYTFSLPPPDSIKFDFSIDESGSDSYFIEKSLNRDTVTVWLTDSTVYSRQIITTFVTYPFTDSSGVNILLSDTIMMRYLAPRATPTRTRVTGRNQYKVTSGVSSGSIKPGRQIILASPTPFRPPDTSRLRLYEVLKDQRIQTPFTLQKDSSNSCLYRVDAALQMGKNYLFIADSAAFGSIYGEYNDSIATRFSVMSQEMLGKLTLNIMNNTGNIIIQLLNNAEKLIEEVHFKDEGKLEFPYLGKGFYRLRVIYDLNGDGKWTTGDFETRRQPEPVSYYPSEIEIKVNWEITQDWDIGLRNRKDFKLTAAMKGRR